MRLEKQTALLIGIYIVLTVCFACNENIKKKIIREKESMMQIDKNVYGSTIDNNYVSEFSLRNVGGIEVNIITYGGIITKIMAPDSEGRMENVVLGFDNLEQYEKENPFFGALVGRYGNRIAKGKFSLEGVAYTLEKNNGDNSLHGGLKGFDKVVWQVEEVKETDSFVSLKLSYLSEDMEEGFPGNLKTNVTYTLHKDNSLDVLYEATTDKTTIVNLTQHSYFNLSGNFSELILDHEVAIDADKFVPVDPKLIPLGELASVQDTPFDFRKARLVGNAINADNEQIKLGSGYDHCWVLNSQEKGYRLVAKAYHSKSGRLMEVFTDQPGMQLYTGNFLDGTLPVPGGGTYAKRSGLCFETQHYPDSPNQPQFPSTTLEPGKKYITKTTFKFSTK
ncbi:aldose 1-epimerase [Maribacter aquivivus]|uniref:Aldose 1-epimerase n=1 Tax=Maribacter aquivivus TaxID=228958 RepID=A0A1M6MLE5_9FLAO|nr:aldose epimerase family protein [Maribacter aquivivus]SHJ84272.1 aldose 1-epimerase [Maribacter aquivivus]